MIKKVALMLTGFVVSHKVSAQEANGIWQVARGNYTAQHGKPVLQANSYKTFLTTESKLQDALSAVQEGYDKASILVLPTPDGRYRTFRVWESPMMEAALAAKYPGIKTYTAEAINNKQVTAKIDYTTAGFHALVFDGSESYLIDPYTSKPDGAYVAYYKKDYNRGTAQLMSCELEGNLKVEQPPVNALLQHGTLRRQYRLALAADSEYCVAVAGVNPTKAAVLSAMTTTMNRVNGVYERELAITMVFVANMDQLIFNTTAPDPYTNSSASTMLSQNQATVNTLIGSANYDIGHVFGTGNGGIAAKGSVCFNNSKARGVTGRSNPTTDAFDIDYVAHEMGHQYGGDHTFNASTGSCAGNGVIGVSVEPGSGSTIMAYAGICGGGNDFQSQSDAYFNSVSLEQISAFVTGSATCASTSASPNQYATIAGFAASYNIPKSTPFELTAPQAVDATADVLTYCWEQRNGGGVDFGKTLAATSTDGPLFRSFPPSASRTRVFPALNRLLSGANTPGEKLPDVTRVMTFKLTERDVYQGWGTFNVPSDAITLNVDGNSGPFKVNSPVSGDSWTAGTYRSVLWDVAKTTQSPVSCSSVDIFLSIDGGQTFPYKLATGTPNDGSEGVFIPHFTSNYGTARIKVKGSGNVFFNVSQGNFDIFVNPLSVGGTLSTEDIVLAPQPASNSLTITIPQAAGTQKARLLSTMGQEVWSGSLSGRQELAVGQLPRGVYYLQLTSSGQLLTRSIVLQ